MAKNNQGFVLATTIKALRKLPNDDCLTAANLLAAQDRKIKELESFKASVLDNLAQQAAENKAAAAAVDAKAKEQDKKAKALAKKLHSVTKSLTALSDELLGLETCAKCGSTGPTGPCSWCAEAHKAMIGD